MFGTDGTTILALALALCGLVPVGLALADIPGVLTAEGANRPERLVGFLSGRQPVRPVE